MDKADMNMGENESALDWVFTGDEELAAWWEGLAPSTRDGLRTFLSRHDAAALLQAVRALADARDLWLRRAEALMEERDQLQDSLDGYRATVLELHAVVEPGGIRIGDAVRSLVDDREQWRRRASALADQVTAAQDELGTVYAALCWPSRPFGR